MRRLAELSFIVLVLSSVSVDAAVRRVRVDYPTIQAAIEDCNDGDVVIVDPGVYYETINFGGRNIVLTSTDPNDPKIVGYTVINAQQEGSVVIFENGETPKAVLTGFTLTGGVGTLDTEVVGGMYAIFWGGGIFCDGASPTITRNVISGNRVPFKIDVQTTQEVKISYGGGISCLLCSPIITNNIIKNNSSYAGGGIITYVANARITDNLIYGNSAYIAGGVALILGTLSNNTIVNNDVELSGGQGIAGNLYVVLEPTLNQSLVFNNIICSAASGGGIYWEGGDPGNAIFFNDVWNNTPCNYISMDPQTGAGVCGNQLDLTGLLGNISKDPLFTNPGRNDFHLLIGSPCINTGDPSFVPAKGQTDIDGQPRIYAFKVDIGADEYVGYFPPVAYAGPDLHVLQPLQLVTLDGTESFVYDPCGIVTFQWKQVAGPDVTLSDSQVARPTFIPPVEGEYRFSLVVGDDENVSSPDEVMVLVRGNQVPVADAGPNKAWKVPGQVILDGTRSYDPDPPDRLSYKWRQLKGPQVVLEDANTANAFFVSGVEVVYLFELIVSDGFSESAPCTVQVTTVGVVANRQTLNIGFNPQDYSHYPDLSGNKLVCCVGTGDDYSWGLMCKDLRTGQVTGFGTEGIDTQPRIDGDLVVWAGGPVSSGVRKPENLSIFARNISGAIQITLCTPKGTTSFSHPAISGNKVVWLRHPNADKTNNLIWQNSLYDICGADITNLTNPVYFTIATGVGRRDPYAYQNYETDFDHVIDISGNIVVWEANDNIFGADISNLADIKVFTISNHPARQYNPVISGSIVVWTDERNDSGDIYGADISDLANIHEFELVRAVGIQRQPTIDGCLIGYAEGPEFNGTIKICCLTKKYGVLRVELPSVISGAAPVIDGQTLIWLTSVSYGVPQGVSLSFGYSVADGAVKNVTMRKCYDYIQHAIVSASMGDRIVVGRGIYREKIDFKGKNLTVSSADPNDGDIVAKTIITGGGQLVSFSGSEDESCVLAGFTITGGSRGIQCSAATPIILGCVIKSNAGVGIRLSEQSDATIANCTICDNTGAGVEMVPTGTGRVVKQSYATITNCIIEGNRQHGIFGGISTVNNCTIVKNLLPGVSGVRSAITNSIIYYNGAKKAGVQIEGGLTSVTYSDIQGGWAGLGNIGRDPCFVNVGCWAHKDDPQILLDPEDLNAVWIMGDYHLLSEAWRWDIQQQIWTWDDVTSPCIDAGNPGCPLGQEPLAVPDDPANKWGRNVRIDMGAFGGTPEAGIAPHDCVPLADINNDGIVDLRDFALEMGAGLGLATPNPADLNRDGTFDLSDLALFVQCWLHQNGRNG